jgi:signal peptidase I
MAYLSTTIHKQMERAMNPMEILRYEPKKGDVIIYNDGSYTEVLEDLPIGKGNTFIKAKFHALGVEPSEINIHTPLIRSQMIQGKCHLCRKEDNDVQDNSDRTSE